MHSKEEFERCWQKEKRVERLVVWPWLALFFIGPLWFYGVFFGGFQRVLENRLGFSYDAAFAIVGGTLLASWFMPPLSLFYLRVRAGLICPHCGPFRTPIRFPFYVLRHDRCPKCNLQIFVTS